MWHSKVERKPSLFPLFGQCAGHSGSGTVWRPQRYGLLPTMMWILLGLGSSSRSFTTSVEIPPEFNALASASAAGFNFAKSVGLNPISTPVRPLICSTVRPWCSFFVKRNALLSEGLYSHPAESTAASISVSRFVASGVSATASSYGVPRNNTTRFLTSSCWYSSSTRSAACCFNRARSLSKDAASCFASRARSKALDAELSAFLASASAFPRKASAVPALVDASVAVAKALAAAACAWPASSSAFARDCSAECARMIASLALSWAFSANVLARDAASAAEVADCCVSISTAWSNALRSVSASLTKYSAMPSPTTPPATNIQPIRPHVATHLGWRSFLVMRSGHRRSHPLKSIFFTRIYQNDLIRATAFRPKPTANQTSGASQIMPIATAIVETTRTQNQKLDDASRLPLIILSIASLRWGSIGGSRSDSGIDRNSFFLTFLEARCKRRF
jgi:hypothetical protein